MLSRPATLGCMLPAALRPGHKRFLAVMTLGPCHTSTFSISFSRLCAEPGLRPLCTLRGVALAEHSPCVLAGSIAGPRSCLLSLQLFVLPQGWSWELPVMSCPHGPSICGTLTDLSATAAEQDLSITRRVQAGCSACTSPFFRMFGTMMIISPHLQLWTHSALAGELGREIRERTRP